MKANRGQIEKALDAAGQGSVGQGSAADLRFFLLYGPDEAGSLALAKRLERAMGPGAERVDLDGSTLRDDPARLSDEAASFSMFGDKRWIRVNAMGEESLPALTALLEAEAAGNPVIAVAGALKATSKLLKLALDHKQTMAFISYQPDAREAEQIAVGIAREGGLRLPSDLARRIVDLANGDRALMAGEIEKLILYLDAAPEQPREATAEALDALSADNPDTDAAPLVNAVLGGDLKAMHKELGRLTEIGASMASVLRPLLTRAMLLANIRAAFDESGRLEAALESAGKAVFWKEKGIVQRQVRLWDASGIARVIQRLSNAERSSRSGRHLGDLLVRHELLTIARQAARER
ncbi:MAG: DNA polymerase III subunit delta [bacterium]|nr:DNA polymerase III subunit delta [bacterium]